MGVAIGKFVKNWGIKDKKTLRQWVAKVNSGESLEDGRASSHADTVGDSKTKFTSVEEELAYVKVEMRLLKKVVSLPIRARMGSAHKRVLFKIVDEMRVHSSLATLLCFSGLSRSGYYKWRMAISRADSEVDITAHIKAIHSLRPFYGYRRMTVALHREEGFVVNHKRVYRLMRKLGIQSVIRKKRRYFGKSGSTMFPNFA